jgi:hypothetical protein
VEVSFFSNNEDKNLIMKRNKKNGEKTTIAAILQK